MSTDIQRQIKRKDKLQAGLFDGRYRQRVVVNKKKQVCLMVGINQK